MTLLARRNLPGPFAVPVSEELLAELADVFSRPQTERYLRPDRASRFMSRLIKVSEWMEVLTPYPDFTDPKDRFLLAMLHDGEADLLVTGDKALLSLGQFQGKPIVSPTVFVSEYLPSP
jgi:uncharacterized protein